MENRIAQAPAEQRHPSTLSRSDYYNLIMTQINHQDDLVNQRVIWLVVSEAFFFIAFVTLLNAPGEASGQSNQRSLLYWLIPIAGLLAGVFTYIAVLYIAVLYIAVLTSMAHIGHLSQLFQRYLQVTPQEDHSVTDFPPIQGTRTMRHAAKITPLCLPLVFIVTWLLILFW